MSHFRPNQNGSSFDAAEVTPQRSSNGAARSWPCWLAIVIATFFAGCRCGNDCYYECDDWAANQKRAVAQQTQLAASSTPPAAASDRSASAEPSASAPTPIVRGQNPNYPSTGVNNYGPQFYGAAPNNAAAAPPATYGNQQFNATTPGSADQTRQPMPASGAVTTPNASYFQPQPNYQPQQTFQPQPNYQAQPGAVNNLPAPPGAYGQPAAPAYGQGAVGSGVVPNYGTAPAYGPNAGFGQPGINGGLPGGQIAPFAGQPAAPPPLDPTADIDVVLQETQTGRFQFGVGVNSDAGVTGQIVIDERNFDWQRVPTSFQDWVNGTAWRGAGQGFRLEAMPGNQVQRYMVSFTEPYLFVGAPLSLNLSAFFYNRRFFDWDEERLGGRLALGYRVSQDLSLTGAIRAEDVKISQPRVVGVPDLDRAVGSTDFFSGRLQLTHDTRDMPFFPSEGHYFELAFEQGFGEFSFPRGELDFRKYFLVRERPDGSGRHTLAYGFRFGVSGDDTPIFENYFSGGYSTMRGFDFRGASPIQGGVVIGGHMRFLGSVEYFFPLTADDMVKGVVFCDFGTTERQIEVNWDNYRVAPGFGLRLNIPALGPAPLALDFAVPVARAPFDNVQNFSFFMGFAR